MGESDAFTCGGGEHRSMLQRQVGANLRCPKSSGVVGTEAIWRCCRPIPAGGDSWVTRF